jgi:hypothetical protein
VAVNHIILYSGIKSTTKKQRAATPTSISTGKHITSLHIFIVITHQNTIGLTTYMFWHEHGTNTVTSSGNKVARSITTPPQTARRLGTPHPRSARVKPLSSLVHQSYKG